ncbi:hypothetical protein OHB54_13940 [Streptomyces sp. NBC_01007]|nr:hypothetical protein OHB54_13940 [Streptomyces sp. NBC_01007]
MSQTATVTSIDTSSSASIDVSTDTSTSTDTLVRVENVRRSYGTRAAAVHVLRVVSLDGDRPCPVGTAPAGTALHRRPQ